MARPGRQVHILATLIGDLRHALRQFSTARVFTVTAVLTLAIGIGGTTAIFTLIHAVMLRSLPVGDPARLYRIGDGDNCCVQGGTQDRWGMFSYPLFERLKADLPEFEALTAFQAGSGRLSARRQGVEQTARPLRSEYVSGNYFSTLGVPAFGGRVFTPADDTPAAAPVGRDEPPCLGGHLRRPIRRWSARRSSSKAIRSPSSA